jgi:hypothetical protein
MVTRRNKRPVPQRRGSGVIAIFPDRSTGVSLITIISWAAPREICGTDAVDLAPLLF